MISEVEHYPSLKAFTVIIILWDKENYPEEYTHIHTIIHRHGFTLKFIIFFID